MFFWRTRHCMSLQWYLLPIGRQEDAYPYSMSRFLWAVHEPPLQGTIGRAVARPYNSFGIGRRAVARPYLFLGRCLSLLGFESIVFGIFHELHGLVEVNNARIGAESSDDLC